MWNHSNKTVSRRFSSSRHEDDSSSFGNFDYNQHWYPVSWLCDLKPNQPTKVTLFDVDYVVAVDHNQTIVAALRESQTLDPNTISLSPRKAIATLLESQNMIFGDSNRTDSQLLLASLDDAADLDNVTTYTEVKTKVEEAVWTLMEEAVAETGFDLNLSMQECRNDETMKRLVEELVGDGSDLSDLEEHETTNCQVAMKLVQILAEQTALLGLVSGRFRIYKRTNGRIAIWGNLPEWLCKFYCIGTMRLHGLTKRAANFQIKEGNEYLVSRILSFVS